jgi:hypothetical protein
MYKFTQLRSLNLLLTVRSECSKHLGISHSLIPFDIFTEILHSELQGVQLSVKQLFAKLPYSDMGIRYHIRQLTTEGWIETNPTKEDHRVKTIHSKEKLRIQFALLSESLTSALINDELPHSAQINLLD